MMGPKPDQLRRAIRALGYPVNESAIGTDKMTPDRVQSVLLALLTAYSIGHLNNSLASDPTMTPPARAMLFESATAETTEGDAASGLSLALFMQMWIRDLIDGITRDRDQHEGESFGPATLALCMALMTLLDAWSMAAADQGVEIGGEVYHVVPGPDLGAVLGYLRGAAVELRKLGGPPDPRHPGAAG